VTLPPYISLPPTDRGSTVDAAVPHLSVVTAHPLQQVLTGLLMASHHEHPVLLGQIALLGPSLSSSALVSLSAL
jgi:hypothetical protein